MHSDFSDELFHCRDIPSQAHEVLPEAGRNLAGPVPGKKLHHKELQLHIISTPRVWGPFLSFENTNGLTHFKAMKDLYEVI